MAGLRPFCWQILTVTKSWHIQGQITNFQVLSKVTYPNQYELQYLAVIVNHATTGHKLQGKTLKSLVITEWSSVKDWASVVLSCVKRLSGLFLMSSIPEDIDFGPAEDYLDIM
jgi:hypothetical protein